MAACDAQAQLLPNPVSAVAETDDDDGCGILYRASFQELEENIVNYETAQWILLSLMLILAWGVGLLMLLYLPLRRYVVRQDIRSRRLYVTANAIVYKVKRPLFLPCLGVSRRDKHILLPLITDVAIEQGCLQSAYGIYSIKIENASQRKPPPGDDLQILGVVNPRMFRKVVLMALSNLRREQGTGRSHVLGKSGYDGLNGDTSPSVTPERSASMGWAWQQAGRGLSSWQMSYAPVNDGFHEGSCCETIIKKMDDIGNSIKRLEVLIETPR